MKRVLVTLPFPLKGLSENFGYEDQPEGTTVDASNVRGYDPATGRARGGQRPGLSKFNANQIGSGGTIQCVAHVIYSNTTVGSTLELYQGGDLELYNGEVLELRV